MFTGRVKFWKEDAGYGFIANNDGTEVFCHVSGCEQELKKGDLVTFEIAEGKKGPNAVKVKVQETEG